MRNLLAFGPWEFLELLIETRLLGGVLVPVERGVIQAEHHALSFRMLVATGVFSFCGAYTLIGFNTWNKKLIEII